MKLVIPDDALKQHLVVLGKTGAGKSSALRHIVEHLLRQNKRVCVIDPKGDWWGLKWSSDGKSEGFPIITFGDFKESKATDIPLNSEAGKHVGELITSGNRPCVIGFRGWMTTHMVKFWIDFASTIFNRNEGELYIVGDEFHNFAPKGQVKGLEGNMANCLHWSNRLINEGRGLGITCLIASQRPQKVHNDTLTACETLVAMRVIHKADRDAVEDWIEGCGDSERGKEVLNSLAGMARGEAFVWSPEIDFGPKRVTFPMFETFDSFAPPQLQKKVHGSGWGNVDLEAVKTKLANVIEEAKANDPTELKRKIRELEHQIKHVVKDKAPDPIIEKVPVLDDNSKQILIGVENACKTAAIEAKRNADALETLYKSVVHIKPRLETSLAGARIPAGNLPVSRMVKFAHNRLPIRPAGDVSNGDGSLSGGRKAVLIAAAQHPNGVTDEQIAVLTGYKKTSRTTFKQQLMSQGLLTQGGLGFVATEEGIKALGHDYDPLPTGDQLREHWMKRLSGGELQVFELCIGQYPNPISKSVIEDQTNYKSTSVNTFCQKLSARQLITTSREGVRAADNLFE